MNKLSTDLSILAITLVASFIYNFFLYRHPAYVSKKGITYFLVFLAMYSLLNMVGHLIAIGSLAFIRLQAGTFQYDMRFYTLIQFGVLLLLINAYLLYCINKISRGKTSAFRQVVIACVLQIAIILPLFPFNPISLLPAITSILLMLTLYIGLISRSFAATKSILQKEERPATYA